MASTPVCVCVSEREREREREKERERQNMMFTCCMAYAKEDLKPPEPKP